MARKACRAVSVERRPCGCGVFTAADVSPLITAQESQETAAMLSSNVLIHNSFGEINIWNAVH